MESVELESKLRLLVEAAGFRLLEAFWKPMKGRPLLRVMADAEDHNITVDECADLSRAISDLLDSYPHDFPDYRLEVTSPGLDRPLEPWQYRKNLGRLVEAYLSQAEGAGSLKGDLIAVADDHIALQGQGQEHTLMLAQIRQIIVRPRLTKV